MGTVGTKFGPKFAKLCIIGVQIGPSGHYRGWILSKGGCGSKSSEGHGGSGIEVYRLLLPQGTECSKDDKALFFTALSLA